MKQLTIWQRLNTALILLIVLLLVGVGLALWVEESRAHAEETIARISSAQERMQADLTALSDGLRGVLLNPKGEEERRALQGMLRRIRDRDDFAPYAKEHYGLARAAQAVKDFTLSSTGGFALFMNRVLEMVDRDAVNATSYYLANFGLVNRERDQLLGQLTRETDLVKEAESKRAHVISIVGVACIGAILLASLWIGHLQSAAVTEPLRQLVELLERMRQGDFTRRLDWRREDEFGALGQGLNRLADDLSELVRRVQESGVQVNSTATRIAAVSREQQSTAHEIAATTAEIGATSKEISSTSKDLVKTMNEVNQVAEQAALLAGSGQSAISSMEATMRHIMESSGSITAKLAVLSDKTSNINSVVTTITKVADQTNLLSLNAAIEAEKAGEYGLGFAVVAMEIRRLADQTAVATYDIEKMIKEMQSAVAAGVMGMDKFSEEVRRGAEEVRKVGAHLAQIIAQVQALSSRFQMVNEGMHNQAAGAQQISETLNQLGAAAQQTAESLRRSNVAIEQLNGAATGLQASVARFRLNGQ